MIQPSLVRPRRSGAAVSLDQQVDGRIAHPCLVELDDFIDGERMRRAKNNMDPTKPISFFPFPKCSKAPNEVEALRFMFPIFPLPDLDFLRFYGVTEIFRIETVLPAVGGLRLGIHKKPDLRPIRLRQLDVVRVIVG